MQVEEEYEDSSSDSENPSSSSSENSDDERSEAMKAKASAALMKESKGSSALGGSSVMAELDMDRYDNSESENDSNDMLQKILGSGNPGMAYYSDPRNDPYLVTRDKDESEGKEDSDTDSEDMRLKDTDLLIMATRNDEDLSHLEVWVYEPPGDDGEGNLYVHHSIMLSSFPLAAAWMDFNPLNANAGGNFAAVGTLDPDIEIWDLDMIDIVEPVATLQGALQENNMNRNKLTKLRGKGSKSKHVTSHEATSKSGGHEDSVMGLAWNSEFRNVLASASADRTVKIWDVSLQQVSKTLTLHTDKVQSLAWNEAEPSALLSGGFDRFIYLKDIRSNDSSYLKWNISSDVESIAWNPHTPTQFVVSMENGQVCIFDARASNQSLPLVEIAAHEKPATVAAFCPSIDGILVTTSTDKRTKVWSIGKNAPAMLAEQELKVGAIFGAGFCRDAPTVFAAGGAKGDIAVWDINLDERIQSFISERK